MNFEECYRKLEEETATQEEAAFVAAEIVRARKILKTIGDDIHEATEKAVSDAKADLRNLLDSDIPTAAELAPAEDEAFRKARKKHIWNITIRIILVTLFVLAIVAGGILWYIFGTAAKSARQHEVYSRDQALDIAQECVENYVGHSTGQLIVHDIDRHLNMSEGINNATRVLEFELNDGVTEYEVRVNLATGVAAITDIDN